MTIINLTPHTVNFIGQESIKSFEPSGQVARVSTEYFNIVPDVAFDITGLNFISTEFGEAINLPDEKLNKFGRPEKLYIVSAVLKSACQERKDLIVPADLVRDEKGNVIGCKAFDF